MKKGILSVLIICLIIITTSCKVRIKSFEECIKLDYEKITVELFKENQTVIDEFNESQKMLCFMKAYNAKNYDVADYFFQEGADLGVPYNSNYPDTKTNMGTAAIYDILTNCKTVQDRKLVSKILEQKPNLIRKRLPNLAKHDNTIASYALKTFPLEYLDWLLSIPNLDFSFLNDEQTTILSTIGSDCMRIQDKKERMMLLIKHGVKCVVPGEKHPVLNMFMWYPKNDDFTDVLDLILQAGGDVNGKDENDLAPLDTAVSIDPLSSNCIAYVKYLLAHGALISETKTSGSIIYSRGFGMITLKDMSEYSKDSKEREESQYLYKTLKELGL